MQTVSEAWLQNQEEIFVSKGYVELTFEVTDPDAQADAEASSNGEVSFASVENIVSEIDYIPDKYSTLEDNIWVLDGTFRNIESMSPKGNNGYIGDMLCDENGVFSTPPVITISFSQTYTTLLQGVTVVWGEAYGNEYALDFTVTAYNGQNIVAQKVVSGNTQLTSSVTVDIQNFNKIVITIQKWNKGYRRARISKFVAGIIYTFTGDELKSFSHVMSSDLMSLSLPKSEIKFEIFNLDGTYNPENPDGIGKYLMERQDISVRYGYELGGSIEWIPGGLMHLSEWKTPANGITASFAARDLLEFMSDKYQGASTGTLYQIAMDAIEQANLPLTKSGTPSWYVDESLSEIQTPAEVDLSDSTIAEVLQLVANAGCCVLFQNREGVLKIVPLSVDTESIDYDISSDNSYSFPETELDKPVKSIVINDTYSYSVNAEGDNLEINNPLISEDQAQIVANWIKQIIASRQCLSGEWRADPRLDCLDVVNIETQFGVVPSVVNSVTYEYSGAVKGIFSGRKTT